MYHHFGLDELDQTTFKKNPILSTLARVALSNKETLGFDIKAKFQAQMILKLIEVSMEEKVKMDVEMEQLDFDQRKYQQFSKFLYDSILMQYGLKTIAIRNIVQLCNGVHHLFPMKNTISNETYVKELGRIIGMRNPAYNKD